MSSLKRLGKLLSSSGLMARKQEGKILLYNRSHRFLSRGILVEDLNAAEKIVLSYIRYLQTSGFLPLTEFASNHQLRPVAFKEVDNRVDEQSAYYINKAAMSSVSRINLLLTAKALRERAYTSLALRASAVNETDIKRYLKLKKVASYHFDEVEKVG